MPIRHLINGAHFVQEPVAEVTYYHVELPAHDVILAEGARGNLSRRRQSRRLRQWSLRRPPAARKRFQQRPLARQAMRERVAAQHRFARGHA